MRKQFETYGFYEPSFFFISINTDESLIDINSVSRITLATFFHEYIHFLQDLYTLFGLRNNSYIVNLVYQLNQELKKTKGVPPVSINNQEYSKLSDLFNIYHGSTQLLTNPIDIIHLDYTCDPNNAIEGYQFVEYVNLNVKYFEGGEDSYYLGAHIIQESQAHMIEYSIFGISNVPIFPYKIVDYLIDFKFNDLKLSRELRIALCEEALNSGHPGRTLIELLENLQKDNLRFNSAKELHSFCHRNNLLMDDKGVKLSIPVALDSEINKCQSNLKTYFPEKNIKINNWIDFVFNEIKSLRQSGFYLSDLTANENYVIKIINQLGTPLVANKKEYYFMNPKIDQKDCHISLFLAIKEFLNISFGFQDYCTHTPYCSKEYLNLVDQSCKNNPFNVLSRNNDCALKLLLIKWGLKE